MKFLIQVTLTAFLSYVTAQFLPWWSFVICAAIVALALPLSRASSFLGGFIAISLLWMLVAAVIEKKNNAILSSKIAPLLGLQHCVSLILLTGLLGGILGGLGGLSGQQLRTLFLARKTIKPMTRRY